MHSVTVRNTAGPAGATVVLGFVSTSSVAGFPIRRLFDFNRTRIIEPGGSDSVVLRSPRSAFALSNEAGISVVTPGEYILSTGDPARPVTKRVRVPALDAAPPTASSGGGDSSGGADLGWMQSYKAGYRDSQAQWAGGSEIMHIKSHKGKLFAFNGYWKDNVRWRCFLSSASDDLSHRSLDCCSTTRRQRPDRRSPRRCCGWTSLTEPGRSTSTPWPTAARPT